MLKGRRADGKKAFLQGRRVHGTNDFQFAQDEGELYRFPGIEHYRKGTGNEPDLLYRLPEVLAAMAERPEDPVSICEGEKDADRLWSIGLIAATNPKGALNWKPEFNSTFAARDVVVLTDNDDKGRNRTAQLRAALVPVAKSVKAILLPDLPENGDVSDWLDTGKTKEELLAAIEADACEMPPWLQEAADAAEIARLAALPAIEFDRARKEAAKSLGISVATLDDLVKAHRAADAPPPGQGTALDFSEVDPWHEEVDGQELMRDAVAALKLHVVFPSNDHTLAVALWAVHTHLLPLAEHSPRLHITAPTKGCGKTVLLNTVAALVPRPLRVEHVTSAALFRVIEEHHPTLLIDEVDTFLKDNEDMRGLLNAGHQPDTRVVRCVGDKQEVRGFSVFAATALAGIGEIPPTIEDRSITIPLRRRVSTDEKVDRLRRNRDHLALIARRIARWTADNADRLMGDPVLPEELGDRPQDNWRFVVSIADAMGGELGKQARQAALVLEGEKDHDDNDAGLMALADVHEFFALVKNSKAVASSSVVEALVAMKDRPWAQWRRGSPLTQNSLARLLKPFGIKTKQVKAFNGKGYERDPIEEAFGRYCKDKPEEEIEADEVL